MGLDRRWEGESSAVAMRWALMALRRRCAAGVGSISETRTTISGLRFSVMPVSVLISGCKKQGECVDGWMDG